jgi:septal ring factor EnvC (AmiA/AmiB activator)
MVFNVLHMKRIYFFLAAMLLATPTISKAQDAATEERLNKLSGEIQNLMELQATQSKRIEALSKELLAVQQEQQNKPVVNYASQDDVKQLAAKLQEVDRKRQEDNALLLKELKNLGKTLSAGPPKKIAVSPNPASAGNETGTANPASLEKWFEHVVQAGETPGEIAKAYSAEKNIKVTVKDILAANPGLVPERMLVGQKIRIPVLPP